MKIPGKTHLVFSILLVLLTAAMVAKKLMLPFSPIFLMLVFDAAAVSFFLRSFIALSKDERMPGITPPSSQAPQGNGLGFQLNIIPFTFCLCTLALLIRIENWRGWYLLTNVAFIMLLLISIPFVLSIKGLRVNNKKSEATKSLHGAASGAIPTAGTKRWKMLFIYLVPWIYFLFFISLSLFSNPREFYNFFNGNTYEQYIRIRYSQKDGTKILERFKSDDAASLEKSEHLFKLGIEAEAKEDYEVALKNYNYAIDVNPDNAEAIYRRGLLKLTKLELTKDGAEEAVADFSRAIELKPDFHEAYEHRVAASNYLIHSFGLEGRQDLIDAAKSDSSLREKNNVK